MRIYEIYESNWYYHGTSLTALAGIRKEGLVPSPPPDYCWPEYDDEIEEYDEPESDLPEAFENRTFFSDNIMAAKEYADNNIDPVILRVKKDAAYFEHGQTDHPYVYTTEVIPPSHIEYLCDNEWKPITIS